MKSRSSLDLLLDETASALGAELAESRLASQSVQR